jgi:catechol 2,3-dioxygenase
VTSPIRSGTVGPRTVLAVGPRTALTDGFNSVRALVERVTTDTDAALLPDETHLGRTALRVADRERLVEFYREVVGLSELDTEGAVSTLGVDGTALLLLEETDAPERTPDETGLYHNAFRVPSRGALGDALGRIRERWRLDGAADHSVSEALYLTDPEGNGVEIYRDLPESDWPLADGGTVRIDTNPFDLDPIAAAASGAETVPHGTDLGHIHLEVSSIPNFEEFYVDLLGFEPHRSESTVRFVSAGGYHHHIGANTWNHRTKPARGRGLSWFEVVVPDESTIESIGARAADRDVPVDSLDAPDGGIELSDPDDITVRVRTEA